MKVVNCEDGMTRKMKGNRADEDKFCLRLRATHWPQRREIWHYHIQICQKGRRWLLKKCGIIFYTAAMKSTIM